MTSLESRITRLVLVSLAVIMLPLVTLTYLLTMEEVEELGDARLAQNARTISALIADTGSFDASSGLVDMAAWHSDARNPLTVRGHHYETQIGFQYWNQANVLVLSTDNLRSVPLDAAPAGFVDLRIEKRRWRVFTLLDAKRHWVRVGERYDSRREIARAMAVETMAPLLIGLPILALVVGWAVRRGIQPLNELADRLASRRTDSVEPLGVRDLPREMVPVVASLNDLLGKLRAALEQEREFTAHAAHELRTPLAGALVHVENARAAATAESRQQSLTDAREGLTRLTRIINQMLDLARWDAELPNRMTRVNLDRCMDEELQEIGLMASDKDVEIVVDRDGAEHIVHGWEPGLRTLVRNLLDNAIRYNVHGGRVDVGIRKNDEATLLWIADTGPGIDPAQRASMFQRFRRGAQELGEGSGLGLSLVARIAQLHGVTITLADADGTTGLRVEVTFPPVPASAGRSGGRGV